MKRISHLLVIVLMLFAFVSCEKYDFNRDISGNWNIFKVSGGFFPYEVPYNFTRLRIGSNETWVIFSNDTIKASGTLSVYRSKHAYKPALEDFYVRFHRGEPFYSEPTLPMETDLDVEFQNSDTLIFSMRNVADGFQYYFAK